ncbi:hypothetical protein KEM52_006040 [Ascosphaera acerosa]|nr:hypothetical protein KEM52_006040 [Ascosphaera acerosa]
MAQLPYIDWSLFPCEDDALYPTQYGGTNDFGFSFFPPLGGIGDTHCDMTLNSAPSGVPLQWPTSMTADCTSAAAFPQPIDVTAQNMAVGPMLSPAAFSMGSSSSCDSPDAFTSPEFTCPGFSPDLAVTTTGGSPTGPLGMQFGTVSIDPCVLGQNTPNSMAGNFSPTIATDAANARDQCLLEGRRQGWTYKDIKRRFNLADSESTLRGRYRSLTKPKENRVRKPVWTPNDIRLLCEAVQVIGTGSKKGDKKAPWTEIANYITSRGGSYCFGNTTCKRKWTSLMAQQQ